MNVLHETAERIKMVRIPCFFEKLAINSSLALTPQAGNFFLTFLSLISCAKLSL